MVVGALATAALATAPGCRCGEGAPPAGAASSAVATEAAAPLPRADRVFAAPLAPGAADAILGAMGGELWVAEPTAAGHAVRFRVQGPGVVSLVAAGDAGRGHRLYLAWGSPRHDGSSPLVLQEIDPATGAAVELFRRSGERSEAVYLAVRDVDRDGRPDLAFAYFATKQEVRTRHLTARGSVVEGEPTRMAQARAFGDLDGDGVTDEIVGRLYGDVGLTPGDLRVDLGRGWVTVPTEGGVRAVAVSRASGAPALLFADGWAADYGKQARARLRRARWNGAGFTVETLGASPDEFTFYSIEPLRGKNPDEMVMASGNRRVTLFRPSSGLPWPSEPLAEVGDGVAAAARDANDGWALVVPGASPSASPIRF